MFLLVIIVILIASTSILWNIYVWLFSFQQNYNDLDNYYASYYWAISSIERGLLVTKYKKAGFVWSGGFIWSWSWWPISDILSGDLWQLNKNQNWFYWDINSRTQNISWQLDYTTLLNIILTLDDSNNLDNPYINTTWINIIKNFFNNTAYISWVIIDENNLWDITLATWISVKRKLEINNSNNEEYIIPTSSPNDWNEIFNDNINDSSHLHFHKNTHNIHDISAPQWSWFSTNITGYGSGISIWDILTWWYASWVLFNITWNYIETDTNNILPYLKYYFDSDTEFADTNYIIVWEAVVWNYKKTIIIKKPTSNYKNTSRKNFIFPYYN